MPDATPSTPGAWFGEPWPTRTQRAPVCVDDTLRTSTPSGQPCLHCVDPVMWNDRGTYVLDELGPQPVHVECSHRNVVGGIGHHEDHAYWCVQQRDPDGGRTYRQSALEVWALFTNTPEVTR